METKKVIAVQLEYLIDVGIEDATFGKDVEMVQALINRLNRGISKKIGVDSYIDSISVLGSYEPNE